MYFREEKFEKNYITYKAHLYLLFKYSLGEFPPKLIKSKAIETYCGKLLNLLEESNFEIQVRKILPIFNSAFKTWLDRGRSRFGVKDNKEFTDLLIDQARKNFMPNQKL